MTLADKTITIYLLAGVATAPLFMEGLRLTMTDRLQQDGWQVRSRLLYPYGDWSRKLPSQLREASHDLLRARTRPLRSIGGQRAAAAIQASSDGSLPLLIGHSAGGVAAVHAVQILAAAGGEAARGAAVGGSGRAATAESAAGTPTVEGAAIAGADRSDGEDLAGAMAGSSKGAAAADAAASRGFNDEGHNVHFPHRVVQIGSPKCPIPAWMRESVLYAGALNVKGSPSDLVTRLGSWSGWRRNARGRLTWSRNQFAPSTIIHFPVIGGHPDYFRESSPFLNREGTPNMEITMQTIWEWFQATLGK